MQEHDLNPNDTLVKNNIVRRSENPLIHGQYNTNTAFQHHCLIRLGREK